MNVLMPKHYKLQLQQLAQPLENNYLFNQYLFQIQKCLIAVGTNLGHVSFTYI
jgi:hypothetical protein